MKLKPLHDKVLVKRTDEEQTTPGGILLPGSAAEKPSQGEVVAVGPGKRDENGVIAPIGVEVGDLVIFGQYGGNEVKIDGEEYIILSESDIYGVFS
jgi:chaperonin GroES